MTGRAHFGGRAVMLHARGVSHSPSGYYCFTGCGGAEEVRSRNELLFSELRPVERVQELAGQLCELRGRGTRRSLRSTFTGATAVPLSCPYYLSP